MAAADVEGQTNHVSHLHLLHRLAHLDHFAKILVAQHLPNLHVGATFIHVQVRAADIRGGDLHQHIRGLFNFRFGDFLDLDIARSIVNESFHIFFRFSVKILQSAFARVIK